MYQGSSLSTNAKFIWGILQFAHGIGVVETNKQTSLPPQQRNICALINREHCTSLMNIHPGDVLHIKSSGQQWSQMLPGIH
jgi:hypothetical protein